jgi:hypothetical protein
MSERKKLKMVASTIDASLPLAVPRVAPDAEVPAVAKRRQFTAAYKLAVLEEADRARIRRDRCAAAPRGAAQLASDMAARTGRRRGRGRAARPRPSSGEQRRIAALEATTSAERELEQARTIIGVQKKLCTLLGLPTAESTEDSGSES